MLPFLTKILLTVGLCFISFLLNAAETNIYIHSLTTRDGLSNDYPTDIVQDSLGLIWIATESGLNCYDGTHIKSYFSSHQAENTLMSNVIHDLHVEEGGSNIWIAAEKGLHRYNYATDDFTRYYYASSDGKKREDNFIAIASTDSLKLWLLSYHSGLFCFDKATGVFAHHEIKNKIHPDIAINGISLYADNQTLWIGTIENGVYKFTPATNTFEYYAVEGEECHAHGFYKTDSADLMLATAAGLRILDEKAKRFIAFDKGDALLNESCFFINENRPGEIWIGTEDGVYISDKSDFENKDLHDIAFMRIKEGSKALSGRSARNSFTDKEGNVWLSLYSGGVNYIGATSPFFGVINNLHLTTSTASLSANKILSMTIGADNSIYLGTDGEGILKMNSEHQILAHYRFTEEHNFRRNIIQTVFCQSENVIWAGTYLGGLIVYNEKNRNVRVLHKGNSKLPDNDIRSIARDQRGYIWVATSKGLCKMSDNLEIITTYTPKNSSLQDDAIRSILFDKSDNMWISTYNGGIYFFDQVLDNFTHYGCNPNDLSSLPDNAINTMYMTSDGILWVATKSGKLSMFDTHNKNFTNFDDALIPRNIHAFAEDKEGHLWMISNLNITRFNRRRKRFQNFNQEEINKVGGYQLGSCIVSSSGRIYFGGKNGILFFEPKQFNTIATGLTTPLFTGFYLFNEKVVISTDSVNTPLKKNILLEKKITLSHDQSVFAISFVTPIYGEHDNLKYTYILEGEESGWNQCGKEGMAQYRNLPPGIYHFKVQTLIRNDIWNKSENILTIEVLPPWWLTTWMKIIYLLLFILSVYALYLFLAYRLHTRNKLKQLEMEKLNSEKLYQTKLEFFTNISHEFRTPLTLISSPIEKLILTENEKEKRYLLRVMKRNADRLLRLINQILDLRRIDSIGIHLQVEKGDIGQYIKVISSSFRPLSRHRNIDFRIENKMKNSIQYFDKEIVDNVIHNLLSNAFKFTPEEGEISVMLNDIDDNYWGISIEDTGIGIAPEYIEKIFDRFFYNPSPTSAIPGTGIGLHMVKELMEIHKGFVTVDSAPGEGSRFSLYFPLDVNVFESEQLVSPLLGDYETQEPGDITSEEEQEDLFLQRNHAHKETILIVEDEYDISQYIAFSLNDEMNVLTAPNGAEALSIIKKENISLIISDIMMPVMDGVELCSLVKNDISTSHIPFILLTAKDAIQDQIQGLQVGAEDYLSKPFNVEVLKVKIRSVLLQKERLKKRYSRCLTNLSKELDASDVKPLSLDDVFITKAVEIVNAHIIDPDFNGERLAQELNLSRAHLHRKLKSLTNLSSSEFIRNIRLENAVVLLKYRTKTIAEIAYETGFNSPTYFSSCFTKFYGHSPKEFQKNL